MDIDDDKIIIMIATRGVNINRDGFWIWLLLLSLLLLSERLCLRLASYDKLYTLLRSIDNRETMLCCCLTIRLDSIDECPLSSSSATVDTSAPPHSARQQQAKGESNAHWQTSSVRRSRLCRDDDTRGACPITDEDRKSRRRVLCDSTR